MYPDVIVESHGDDEWIAMGREAAVAGETLILDIVLSDTEEGALRHRLPVCVIDSRPIILDGDIRHRIRLLSRHAVAGPVRTAGQARLMSMSELSAVLMRELRARIIDISEAGCLIEIRRRMEVGTVGTLQLQLGAGEFSDDFDVVRCQAVEGARSLYHVGLRFLWTKPRHAGSIRHAVASYAAELELPDTSYVM